MEQQTGKTFADVFLEIMRKYPIVIHVFFVLIFILIIFLFSVIGFTVAEYSSNKDSSIIGQVIGGSKSSGEDKNSKPNERAIINQDIHQDNRPTYYISPPPSAPTQPTIHIYNEIPKNDNQINTSIPPAQPIAPNNLSQPVNQEGSSDFYNQPSVNNTQTTPIPDEEYQPPKSNMSAESALDVFYNDTQNKQDVHRIWELYGHIENIEIPSKDAVISWWHDVQGGERVARTGILKTEYNEDHCDVGYIIKTISNSDPVAKENCFEMVRDYSQGTSRYGYWIFKSKLSCDNYLSQTYAIQLLATKDIKKAINKRDQYSQYSPYITKKDNLYRVRVGLYVNKGDGELDRQSLPGLISGEVMKH